MKPFVEAFTLLTIIPLPFGSGSSSPPSRFAPLFFPLVGLIIGLGAAALFALIDEFLPRNLTAALVVVFTVGITGALHVDGLADFADGVFGGQTPESRLSIMKKPDIGTFGVAAVVLALGVNWMALSSLTLGSVWIFLPIIGIVSRTAPLVIMSITKYVSANGLGSQYVGIPKPALIVVILLSLVISAAVGGGPTLSIAVGGIVAALVVGLLAKKRLGGANGDVYGAGIELAVFICLIGAAGVVDAGAITDPFWTSSD